MPSKEYWERRQVENAYKVFQDAEKVADQIAAIYHKSSVYISNEIKNIFERFKVKWGLSEQEARELIGSMKDSTNIDELLQKLRNTTQRDEIRELRKQIESSAYRARIGRLAELMDQMDAVMHRVYSQELKQSSDFYRGLAEQAYYRSMYDLQQRAGVAFSFAHIDHKAIDKVISMNWSGKHFSDRIWDNTQALADTVKKELLVNLITGRTEREASNIITERFARGASNARRLVRTESNYISTELNFQAYEEAGIEEYLYLATLDLKTSKICRKLDGKIFKISEKKIGENCPPMHPWCRSTTIAVIDRDLLKDMTRRARDPETGKTYTVPLTMNYEQWYKEYVEGNEQDKTIDGGSVAHAMNTGTKVFFDESKNYEISVDDLDDDINEKLSVAAKELALKGSKDGYEHGILIDLDTGQTSDYFSDSEPGSVRPDYNFLKKHGNTAFLHNHNTDSELSFPDVCLVANDSEINIVAAVRNDGIITLVQSNGKKTTEYLPLRYADNGKREALINDLKDKGNFTSVNLEIGQRDFVIDEYCKGGMKVYGSE